MLGFRHVAAAANAEFVLTIAQSSVKPNIRALAVEAGWNESSKLVVDITAPFINQIDMRGMAFDAGVRLVIRGLFGAERNSALPALWVDSPVEVENLGQILANGGNGGAGQSVTVWQSTSSGTARGGEGGLGAGFIPGTASWREFTSGGEGTTVTVGSQIGGSSPGFGYGGAGGAGGGPGLPGRAGSRAGASGQLDGATYGQIGSGGSASPAVRGDAFITWVALGDVQGRRE